MIDGAANQVSSMPGDVESTLWWSSQSVPTLGDYVVAAHSNALRMSILMLTKDWDVSS